MTKICVIENKIKFVVNACRWFDKVNGNTYHSSNITRVSDGAVLYVPFQYGYEEHYKTTALEAMSAADWFPRKYHNLKNNYERENNYPILWSVTDGLKRDCVANGRANK